MNIHGPKDAARLGIEVVYQDLALADNLDVVQNMFLGREELDGAPPARRDDDGGAGAGDAQEPLGDHASAPCARPSPGLSGGQRQSVAVAKAVMWNSRVVILDEPTAALGVAQTRQVLDLVKRLGEQGLAVILISHNLHDIFEVADTITVLRLGQNVAEFKRTETNQQEVVEAITAGQLSKVPGQSDGGRRMSTVAAPPPAADPARRRATPSARTRGAGGPTSSRGELGSLPIIVGLIIIAIVFQTQNDRFLTAGNFVNLIVQTAPYAVIAMGVTFVLLLGRDRPVDRLRLRRRRRARRDPADPGRQRAADVRS